MPAGPVQWYEVVLDLTYMSHYLAAFVLIPTGFAIGAAIILFNTPLAGAFGSAFGPLHVGWLILCALLLISGAQALEIVAGRGE